MRFLALKMQLEKSHNISFSKIGTPHKNVHYKVTAKKKDRTMCGLFCLFNSLFICLFNSGSRTLSETDHQFWMDNMFRYIEKKNPKKTCVDLLFS